MGLGSSKNAVQCEDPEIISATYPSVLELRKDFRRLYDSIPEGKRVSFSIVIEKGQSGRTNVFTGIFDKQEAYPRMFQRFFNNKPLEESLEESDMIEPFLSSSKNTNLLFLIILIIAIIYRKEIMAFFNKN